MSNRSRANRARKKRERVFRKAVQYVREIWGLTNPRLIRRRATRLATKLARQMAIERQRRIDRMWNRSTYVIVLSDLCKKFTLEAPTYQDIRESGDNPDRIFWIGLTFLEFGLSVRGSSRVSKEEAKEDAACKVMLELRKVTRLGGTLNEVSNHKLRLYCSWMYTIPLLKEGLPNTEQMTALHNWLVARGSPHPVYRFMSFFETTDPPYRVSWFSCTFADEQGERRTIGEGSKKKSKNVAARIMLQLLKSEAE